MEQKICLAAIRNQYESLTRTGRMIADYILEHSDLVIHMNVAQLAEAAGTNGPAVIRFCKSIGYAGFSDFRLSLAMELADKSSSRLPVIRRADTAAQIADKIFHAGIQTMKNTLAMLDCRKLKEIARQCQKAEKICFFGVGTSYPVVIDAQYRFMSLGYPAVCYTDILFMSVAAQNMGAGEVAVAVSHSGRTEVTTESLKLAKKRGAVTVAITSYRTSPLAECADYCLTAYPDDVNYPVEAVSARLAHICILDTLEGILAALSKESDMEERLKSRDEILEGIRTHVQEEP